MQHFTIHIECEQEVAVQRQLLRAMTEMLSRLDSAGAHCAVSVHTRAHEVARLSTTQVRMQRTGLTRIVTVPLEDQP